MASKLGTMLSMIFIFIAFVFGIDFVMIQLSYTTLDSLSTSVSYKISKCGEINENIKEYAYECANVKIEPVKESSNYEEGSVLGYYLIKEYKMISIERDPLEIKVKRFAVINIYG